MKKLIYVLIIAFFSCVSYTLGSREIYLAADCRPDGTESIWYPHSYNVKEALSKERELCNALFEALHRFYSNDDNDLWFEEFVPTKEYQKLDSLLNSDWEDFYYYTTPKLENWWQVYGTSVEPSEEYKDSIRGRCCPKEKWF